jgi:hypothetical protein
VERNQLRWEEPQWCQVMQPITHPLMQCAESSSRPTRLRRCVRSGRGRPKRDFCAIARSTAL